MTLEIHYNVFGCYRSPREDIALAKDAVEAGFNGIWIGDHFLPWLDSRPYAHHALPWLGSLMSEIPAVPVGLSVTCPTMRYQPPLLAQALATLDNMYPDRLEVGVGVGEALNDLHFLNREWPDWGERASMLIEALDLIQRLWTNNDHISFDGKHYTYGDIKLYTQPSGKLNLHWAAWGPQSCRCAGKYAGNLLTVAPADKIKQDILPPFQEGLATAERKSANAEVTTELIANVGDPDALVTEIRNRGEYIPDETELDNPDPRDIQNIANERLNEMSDQEIQEMYNITQDPTALVQELKQLEAAGVTRVLVGSNSGDPYETVTAFEDEVLPHFE